MPAQPQGPTHARHWVVVFAVTLALISYTDRVVIAQAATNIQAELSLSRVQMGWVFFIFSWAYTAFEIPGGWMGDREFNFDERDFSLDSEGAPYFQISLGGTF